MLAKRLDAPSLATEPRFGHHDPGRRPPRAGEWRLRGLQPPRGPDGQVRWWERPAPGGDEQLWAAVVRCHEALHARGWSVTRLAVRLHDRGHPIRRETLSRVLNGRQATSWHTVEQIAAALDVDLPPGDADGG